MVNPRDHRVVVVESLLCPTHFRNTLARVLFNHLNVSHSALTDFCLSVGREMLYGRCVVGPGLGWAQHM